MVHSFPVPDLRQEIRHVDLLVLHLHYPRVVQHSPRTCSSCCVLLKTAPMSAQLQTSHPRHERESHLPACNKVFKVVAPLDPKLWLIFELRNRLPHNVREQVNQPRPCMPPSILRLPERKPVLCNLEQRHAQRPDIRRDGIRVALDAFRLFSTSAIKSRQRKHCHTYCHIVRRPNERIRISLGSDKLPRHAKIAQLHLPAPSDEDIRRFNIWPHVSTPLLDKQRTTNLDE